MHAPAFYDVSFFLLKKAYDEWMQIAANLLPATKIKRKEKMKINSDRLFFISFYSIFVST